MKFLYQLTSFIPNDSFEKYSILYPIADACKIFNFIFEERQEGIIEDIVLISTQAIDLSLFYSIFKKYSPYIAHYESHELFEQLMSFELFPKSLEIKDDKRISKIVSLIKNVKIEVVVSDDDKSSFLKEFKDIPYLINYDHAGDLIKELILNDKNNKNSLLYFSNKKIKLLKGKGYSIVGLHNYFEIKTILDEFCKEETKPRASHYSYVPTHPVLKVFNDTLVEALVEIDLNNERKLKFIRDDKMLSSMAINHLVSDEKIAYYDMNEGIPIDFNLSKSITLDNCEKIEKKDYEKLFSKLTKHDKDNYLILQSLIDINQFYFRKFNKLELPKAEEILENITSIFIALIYESILTKKQLFKLIPLINDNKLKPLLKEFGNLENLNNVIKEFRDVSVEDIFTNIGMWIRIKKELNDPSKSIEEEPIKNLKKLIISFEENQYYIKYENKTKTAPFDDNIGLLNFCIIVLNTQKYRDSELGNKNSIINIRRMVLTFLNEKEKLLELEREIKSDKKAASEKIRKTLASAFRTMEKKYPILSKLLKYKGSKYSISPDCQYEIVVIYHELDRIL